MIAIVFHSLKMTALAAILILASAAVVEATLFPSLLGTSVPDGSWIQKAPLLLAVAEVTSTVEAEGKIYVIGGLIEPVAPSWNMRTNKVQIYNPTDNSWSYGIDYPGPALDHAGAAYVNGSIYLIGGLTTWPAPAVNTVYAFNLSTQTWSSKAPMPKARGGMAVGVWNNKIYCVGGLAAGVAVADMTVYDPAANTWTTLAPMPTPRDHLVAQAVGGKVYVIGGRNVLPGTDLVTNEVYDIAGNTWSTAAAAPTARGGMGSAVLGGNILLFGGESTTPTPFSQNEQYNPGTNTWTTLTPMTIPVHGIGAAVLGGLVYVPGGAIVQGESYSTNHQVFVLGADLAVSKVAYPNPVAAGSVVTYTVSVTNTSANGITLNATLMDRPAGHMSPAQAVRTAAITAPLGVWTVPITFTVQSNYSGPLTNVVTVTTVEGATGVYTLGGTSAMLPVTGLVAQNDGPTVLSNGTHLTATAAGDEISYQWDFGDSYTGAGQAVTHTYGALGLYWATAIASNAVSSQLAQTLVAIISGSGELQVFLPMVYRQH